MLNVSDANKIAEVGCEEVIQPLTMQLKSLANQSGWDDKLVNALSVDYDSSYNLLVEYPEELATDIEDTEYGDLNGLPNAAIRPFIYRAQTTVSVLIGDEIVGSVLEAMEVK